LNLQLIRRCRIFIFIWIVDFSSHFLNFQRRISALYTMMSGVLVWARASVSNTRIFELFIFLKIKTRSTLVRDLTRRWRCLRFYFLKSFMGRADGLECWTTWAEGSFTRRRFWAIQIQLTSYI
jgi:hypothetical protein